MKMLYKFSAIITLLLILLFSDVKAASDPVVKIRGTQASSMFDMIDFYNIEPSSSGYLNEYYYYAVISNDNSVVPQNATISYKWIPVGGTAISGGTSNQVKMKWDNTKNYNNGVPTKSLRLKVTFTWTPQGQPTKTKEVLSLRPNDAAEAQPIEVKHISDPATLSFNGSTVSNGNTLSFACGATQKTLTVGSVVTDPNAPITYYFYYPDGWSGPAMSNVPSVTVNTHVNKSGVIKVEAKRNDSNVFRSKISINITRPLPTIPVINSGDILLCSPQTITASANNATSYNWTTTGGVTANSPGNTNSAQITGVSDGTVIVSATSSVCAMTTSLSKAVIVKRSPPKPASLLLTANGGGAPDFMCNGSGVSLNAYTAEPGTQFGNWTTSDPGNTILNYNGGTAYFNSYVNNCYGIDITVSNCFGSVKKGITICVDNCVKEMPVYKIYPNPASDYLHITFEEADDISLLPGLIRIFSEVGGKEVRTIDPREDYSTEAFRADKTLNIKVSDLTRGTYYLHLIQEAGESDQIRVILQ
ncbi:T9SS type A sorting domain-containing protein [Dyadobacter arcticus]|uniref:Secretion system C-terminal sorting domain-containing protein n=1 Tax=Dyadobacter arcticus TaxID=1078754 RepID=A0ABX0UP29_9BACT|nr:T9SS type A sorting domain-containing protein [Dyadobacter arcticus]NIJ53440.1 hypothetical protein [Dyadobacter arcticus]